MFALAPEAYAAWQALNAAIRAGIDERRYELVTLAAARALGSRYCALAHARVLRDRFYDDRTLHAIVTDRHHAGLDRGDVAAMDFADRIAADPGAAREADVMSGYGTPRVSERPASGPWRSPGGGSATGWRSCFTR